MKNKKIVLAFDSFKECMTAEEACMAAQKGFIKAGFSPENCLRIPMADGGEGTMDAMVKATGGEKIPVEVTSPVGTRITAYAGQLPGGKTYVIDCASACGLGLIPKEKRNPMKTTTYGLGELIKAILDQNPERILIGLGGSGTNDGGIGMLKALGGQVLDKNGNPVSNGGEGLAEIEIIDLTTVDKRIYETEILVACDVNNPLTGEKGASRVYGPQKGADPVMVERLEENMLHLQSVMENQLGVDFDTQNYYGAAGGLGVAIHGFLKGKLCQGIEVVLEYSDFRKKIQGAALVVTGEGKIDEQTRFGKTPYGIVSCAKEYGIPVIALAGCVDGDNEDFYSMGFDAVFSINQWPVSIEEAMRLGKDNMEKSCENVARMMAVKR